MNIVQHFIYFLSYKGEEFLEASKMAARLLNEQDKLYAAKDHFDEAFTRFPHLIQEAELNLFLELLLMQVEIL